MKTIKDDDKDTIINDCRKILNIFKKKTKNWIDKNSEDKKPIAKKSKTKK